jgi:ATP-dependent helicase HepA
MEWLKVSEGGKGKPSHQWALRIGSLVEHGDLPGVARVVGVEGPRVRVDCFDSVAAPVVASRQLLAAECSPVRLAPQTRVFWSDPDTGRWRAGRVVSGDGARYYVRFPNSEYDVCLPEGQLRVRWDRPVDDPVDVLVSGATESPYFRDARLPMLRTLTQQRAACAGAFALLSSAVEIYPHQVRAAVTVLSDPVQRYLLADEVGLGKTIVAGYVIRQTLLDDPCARIVVLAPEMLRRQWQGELREKFFIDDFPHKNLKISAHETADRWSAYHGFDLVVVDEAHQLVQVDGPDERPYRQLATLAHSAPRLLLLSATPVTSRLTTHLGLLHLLDPDLYRWDDREAFQRRFDLRSRLATAVYALDSDYESMLGESMAEIADLLPDDAQFRGLVGEITVLLTDEGDLHAESDRPVLAARVEALRAHISETYRLHRRMIRHRRAQVLRDDEGPETLPFEVRGRVEPEAIAVDSADHQVAQDALLLWQTRIADWLIDRHDDAGVAAYGPVLAVLVSRAGGPIEDLVDAFRWRLHADASAAERAGLTREEQTWLAVPEVAPAESAVLEMLAGSDHESALEALAAGVGSVTARHARVVVFCGSGALASSLVDSMGRVLTKTPVYEHTTRVAPDSCERALALWKERGGALVADTSAEDGLNLQQADAVVHCRLPWSPNRLEQRLGRVDRYVDVGLGTLATPAHQYVLSYPDGGSCFSGAWKELLADGFTIFAASVSTLQDPIDQGLSAVWSTAAREGPGGLVGQIDALRSELADERQRIDGLDLLESVHESLSETRDIAASIGELELGWRDLQAALVGYAGSGEGGLRFHARQVSSRHAQFVRFERGRADPLMPPRMFARGGLTLGPTSMEGVFNRTVALRLPGARLFRCGHPFVDLLASVIAIDDRGQASAFNRRDQRHHGDPAVYFGLDYLVEADIEEAVAMVGDSPFARRAIRRQADRVLEPFLRRVWVQAGAQTATADQDLLAWLDRPYDPRRGDVNLNPDRIVGLVDLFGDRSHFAEMARLAERTGRHELSQVTDLAARCEQARDQARRAIAVRRAQALARRAAGGLVGDAGSYLVDVDITEALASGLTQPRLRPVAVTCLVRGDLETVARVR